MSIPLVRIERHGAVAVVELDAPDRRNVLDVPLANAFAGAVESLDGDASVRAVLLCAAGRTFGVGGDLAAMHAGGAAEVANELISALHGAVQRLAAMDAPVVAALQGTIAGGSWSLALAADLAIAADDASFTLAYGKIGASCDVDASWALPRMVGLRRALEIALLDERIDAARALDLGLVNKVVPTADLRTEALALATRLAEGATLAKGKLKRLMRQSMETSLADQLAAEQRAFIASTATDDFKEGLAAFLGKRAATFRGR